MIFPQFLSFIPLLLVLLGWGSCQCSAQPQQTANQFQMPQPLQFLPRAQMPRLEPDSMPTTPEFPDATSATVAAGAQPAPTSVADSILPNFADYQSQLDAANAHNIDLINQEIQMASNNYRQTSAAADQRMIQTNARQIPQLVATAIQNPTAFPAAPTAAANAAQMDVSPDSLAQMQQHELRSSRTTLTPYSIDPQAEIQAQAHRVLEQTQRLPLPPQPTNEPTIESLIHPDTETGATPQPMPPQPTVRRQMMNQMPLQRPPQFGLPTLQRGAPEGNL